jgi:hypothetical protein
MLRATHHGSDYSLPRFSWTWSGVLRTVHRWLERSSFLFASLSWRPWLSRASLHRCWFQQMSRGKLWCYVQRTNPSCRQHLVPEAGELAASQVFPIYLALLASVWHSFFWCKVVDILVQTGWHTIRSIQSSKLHNYIHLLCYATCSIRMIDHSFASVI